MPDSEQEAVQRERERQRKHDIHTMGLSDTDGHVPEFEEEKSKYLDKLMQTQMSDAGINLLDNMMDRAFILGNITSAEYHDVKWEIHGMYLKIRSNFPMNSSDMTGDFRSFILDDEDEALTPLTNQQKTIIAQMLRGLSFIASRSKEGFQQEMNVKSITVSEILDPEQEEDELMAGIFG